MGVLFLVLSVHPARAAALDDRMAAWAAELLPQIEAATGRAYVEAPALRVASRMGALEALAEPLRPGLRRPTVPDAMRVAIENAAAIYVPDEGRVYVFDEVIRGFASRRRLAPERRDGVLRCVLAHELVHALQHQVATPPVLEGDALDVRAALKEGHADYVAASVCGVGAELLDAVQGLEMRASMAASDPTAFAYGYAEGFMAALTAAEGPGAAWQALEGAPPSRELVARVGATGSPPRWNDPTILAGIADTLEDTTAWEKYAGPVRPEALRWALDGGEAVDTLDLGADGGLTFLATAPRKVVGVFAFLLRGEGVGARWLRGRRAAFGEEGSGVFYRPPEGSVTLLRPPRLGSYGQLAGRGGEGPSLRVDLLFTGGRRYVEAWLARGNRLYGVIYSTAQATPARLYPAVQALLLLNLPEEPAPLHDTDRAALAAWRPTAPAPTGPSWRFRWDVLDHLESLGDPQTCAEAAERAVTEVASHGDRLAALALRCAVITGDLSRADRMWPRAEPVEASGPGVVYAGMLEAAGRRVEALAVLQQACPLLEGPDAEACTALAERLASRRR